MTAVRPASPRAVFLDKDGTLVQDVPYNVDPARLVFTPHAIDGLRRLQALGFALCVVSNQPGLALGRFDRAALQRLARALDARLREAGVRLGGFYACPHLPVEADDGMRAGCACRKPAAGLLQAAACEHGIDLGASWMIGDILNDVEAGRRAGCRTVLLDVGNETVWQRAPLREPHLVATDLLDAARQIAAAPAVPDPAPAPPPATPKPAIDGIVALRFQAGG